MGRSDRLARMKDGSGGPGSFRNDLEALLEELTKPAVLELGKPAPQAKYLPKRRSVRCPAEHNQRLLGTLPE